MSATIDFYFDFSSSYSYLALPGIAQLGDSHEATFVWKPIVLGAIFQAHEHAPPVPDTAKGAYIWHDVERSAELAGLPFTWPDPFPFNGITASRIFWHLADSDSDRAIEWAQAVFNASYGEGRDCSNAEVLAEVAGSLGQDADTLLTAATEDAVKARLKHVTGEAMQRGVFGAPTFFLGDEMFWGGDRLPQLERFLQSE